ncbi:hypothetical protein D3C87_1688860 [compost metagenome]
MANTRNGTRIEYGSRSKPRVGSNPSNQTTAMIEHSNTNKVLRTHRVYQNNTMPQITRVAAKNSCICRMPSIRSPTTLAKPVMWILMLSVSYLARICSSWLESTL